MTAEDIRKSFTSEKGLFYNENGTLKTNVEVASLLYDYAMALKKENSPDQFSDEFINLVKIAKDTSLTSGARNAMMAEKLPNNLTNKM